MPGSSPATTSPPLTVTIDPASPFLPTSVAQHAALLTLQAAAVAQAAAASSAVAAASSTSPFSLPESPNAAQLGGVLLPLASPREQLAAQSLAQQQLQAQQLSPASANGDRLMKTASVGSASSPMSTHTVEGKSDLDGLGWISCPSGGSTREHTAMFFHLRSELFTQAFNPSCNL